MTNTVKILIIAGIFLGSAGAGFGVTKAISSLDNNDNNDSDTPIIIDDPTPKPVPKPTPKPDKNTIAINSVNVKFEESNRRYEIVPQLDSATIARKDSIVYVLFKGGIDESMKVGEYSGKISGVKQSNTEYYIVALNPITNVKSEAFKVSDCTPNLLSKKALESAINKAGKGNGSLGNKIEWAISSKLKIDVRNCSQFSSASYFVPIIRLIKDGDYSSVTVNDVKYSDSDDYRVTNVVLTLNN